MLPGALAVECPRLISSALSNASHQGAESDDDSFVCNIQEFLTANTLKSRNYICMYAYASLNIYTCSECMNMSFSIFILYAVIMAFLFCTLLMLMVLIALFFLCLFILLT